MDEYISRHSMIKTVLSLFITEDEKLLIINRLKSIPAADVRPVVRGAWIPGTYEKPFECSACHTRYYWCTRKYASNFCPNCGADMRQEPPKEETNV